MATTSGEDFFRLSGPVLSTTHRAPRLDIACWAKYRRIIKDLYVEQDRTLDEVVEIMKQEHNFHAT
jgi:hypothetical protein